MEELDVMYKELAEIEKKIQELDKRLYDSPPGSEAFKRLGKQLSGLESQFTAAVNKIMAAENKLAENSGRLADNLATALTPPASTTGYEKLVEQINQGLPTLDSQLARINDEYAENLKLLNQQNNVVTKAKAPWKQLIGSLFSWQSLLAVGINLLAVYGKDIWNFAKGLLGLRVENEALNATMTDFNTHSLQEARALRETYSAIMQTNRGTEERKKAIDQMNAQYGKFLPHLLTEKSSLDEINAAYQTVNKSLRANSALKAQNTAIDKVLEKATGEQAEAFTGMRNATVGKVKGVKMESILSMIPDLTADFNVVGTTLEQLTERVRTSIKSKLGGQVVDESFYKNLDKYVKSYYDSGKEINDIRDNFKYLVNNGQGADTYDHDGAAERTRQETERARQQAAEIKKIREELSLSLKQTEIKLQADRLSLLEDGKNKSIELANQEHDVAVQQIEDEKQARLKQPGVTGDMEKEITNRAAEQTLREHEKLLQETQRIDKEYKAEYEARAKSLTDTLMNEEQRKLSAIKERYAQERTWADTQLRTGGITKEEHQSFTSNVNQAEQKEVYSALLGDLEDYKRKEKEIEDSWAAKITEAKAANDANLVAKLEEGKQNALSSLGEQTLQESDEWERLFGDLDNLTVSQIDSLIAKIEDQAKEMKLNPADTKALTDSLNQAKQQVIQINPFQALGRSLKDVFSSGSKDSKKSADTVKNNWENLSKSTDACFSFVNDAVSSCGVLGDLLGDSGKQVMGMVQGVATAGIAMGSAIKTAETGSIVLAAISMALQVVTALFSVFNNDKKHEKNIQNMQKEVDELGRAYDRLGRVIDNTYSDQVYGLMDDQAENLRRQQQLVAQQQKEEEAKKKTDDKKVQEYRDKQEELNNQIEDTKRKQIEMLAGTDIQSAIDTFADALIEAYAQGENGAEAMAETTKKVLANAVKEALKKQLLGDAMQKAVTRLGEDMGDGVLSDDDKRRFEETARSAGERFMTAMGMYDELFKGPEMEGGEETRRPPPRASPPCHRSRPTC